MSASAQVGSILNFSLMYFLAPVASASAAGSSLGLLQKITGPYFLSKWGPLQGTFSSPASRPPSAWSTSCTRCRAEDVWCRVGW